MTFRERFRDHKKDDTALLSDRQLRLQMVVLTLAFTGVQEVITAEIFICITGQNLWP